MPVVEIIEREDSFFKNIYTEQPSVEIKKSNDQKLVRNASIADQY